MNRIVLLTISLAFLHGRAAEPPPLSADEILRRVEHENGRRRELLKEYSGSRRYTLLNGRFGKEAAVAIEMKYRDADGETFTVVTQSGSDKLVGIINSVLASESHASAPAEQSQHQLSAANYRVHLLGTESVDGRTCFVLALAPRMKAQFLIVGKAWVDAESFGTVRLEGQFASSVSILLGAPHLREDYVEVSGFWLPGHVHSITSSLLLGQSDLDIIFSNYQLTPAL